MTKIGGDTGNDADYIQCEGCGKDICESEAVYATDEGFLTTGYGDPYCDECLPDEPEKKCKRCGKKWQDAEDDLGAVTVRFNYGEHFKGFMCKGCGMNPATGKNVEL